jgi:hypothetical protein
MELKFNELTSQRYQGEIIWACAYDFDDITNSRPSKHIKPTAVICEAEPNAHHPQYFSYGVTMQTLGKKGQPLSKRIYPHGVRFFDTEDECVFGYGEEIDKACQKRRNHIESYELKIEKDQQIKRNLILSLTKTNK